MVEASENIARHKYHSPISQTVIDGTGSGRVSPPKLWVGRAVEASDITDLPPSLLQKENSAIGSSVPIQRGYACGGNVQAGGLHLRTE